LCLSRLGGSNALSRFIFADRLSDGVSPRSQLTGEPLLGPGIWYLIGYILLSPSVGLYALLID